MMRELTPPSESRHPSISCLALHASRISGALLTGALVMNLSACTPKKAELSAAPTPSPFDYSRSDLEGLVEFANRFGTLPDSARIAVCREMDLAEKERKNESRALTLHQAAAQMFLQNCSSSPALQEKLKGLAENPETPPDQRQFASLCLQLILRQESQSNALVQAQKKARSKSNGNGSRRKLDPPEKDASVIDDPSKPSSAGPIPEDVARKKLEAIRNLEKSMDRTLKP